MSQFIAEFTKAAKAGPRLYFAPLAGAFKAIVDEFKHIGQ